MHISLIKIVYLCYCNIVQKEVWRFQVKQNREVLTDKKIASIFLQLIEGIAFMHHRHVMHRDLKLQNILLDQFYNVKISDFGWCIHHPSQRNTFCGTMEYIAPEMLNKQKYQHSIDIYCIGIVLYELFYFKSPFVGQNQEQTFSNIKQGKLNFDDNIRLIPDEAKNLISRLLSQDPLNRPKASTLFDDPFVIKYLYDYDRSSFKRRFTEQTFQRWKDENININEKQQIIQKQNNKNSQNYNIFSQGSQNAQEITSSDQQFIQSQGQIQNKTFYQKKCEYQKLFNDNESCSLYPSLQQNIRSTNIKDKITSPQASSLPQIKNGNISTDSFPLQKVQISEEIQKIKVQEYSPVIKRDD